MSGRPKDQAISEDEYRRKEADAMQRTADQNRALRSMVGRLRALASDWEANSGSRGLGERSEATAWSKAASQLREAISPSEPQAEPFDAQVLDAQNSMGRGGYWVPEEQVRAAGGVR